ncbi:MAG: DUF2079 domain-containing protein [Candidatus Riflebacteria bacterium]|nr:DUF2079 domain-containing protein [Candidatus Riflebacteria bacterium]
MMNPLPTGPGHPPEELGISAMTSPAAPTSRRFLAFLGLLALAWAAFCFRVSWLRWQAWDLGVDTAFWAQLLYRHSLGLGWTVTVMTEETMDLFRFHVHLLLYPLSWLFAVVPHPLTLSAVVHLAHAGGAVLAGLLAHRLAGGDERTGVAAAVVFLLHPQLALAQTTYDFSFRHLAPLLLPGAALTAAAGRPAATVGLLALLVAGSEELALTAAFFLFALAWTWPADRRWYAPAGAAFLLYLGLLIPLGISGHAFGRYAHLAAGPGETLAVLGSGGKGRYLLGMLGPLLALPLLRPTPMLLAALPAAAQNLLSASTDTGLLGHHYGAALGTVLLIASLHSAATLGPAWRRGLLAGLALLGVGLSLFVVPTLGWAWEGVDPRLAELAGNLDPLSGLIPPDASLSAPPAVAARFWRRPALYYFPLKLAEADLVVLPKYLPGYPAFSAAELAGFDRRLQASPDHQMIYENADLRLYRRLAADPDPKGVLR